MAKTHKLKIWPEYFKYVVDGIKTFEYRVNDRDFKPGDILVLKEWNPKTEKYTRAEKKVRVTYLLRLLQLEPYVIMSIKGL